VAPIGVCRSICSFADATRDGMLETIRAARTDACGGPLGLALVGAET
jgi:hypothetical protein